MKRLFVLVNHWCWRQRFTLLEVILVSVAALIVGHEVGQLLVWLMLA